MSIGDHVMIWTPYTKKGLSACFQPKWTGPWIVYSFTGPSNCKLLNKKGEYKNVHINQLKSVEQRDDRSLVSKDQLTPSNSTNIPEIHESTDDILAEPFDIFEDTVADHIPNIPNFPEPNIPIAPEIHAIPPDIINEAWVDINASNIIPQRTRGGGGV